LAVSAIVLAGGIPIFVDIKEENSLINENEIEKAISSQTKAIIATHLFGRACNMTAIIQIAQKYNLIVIEDTAQSFGVMYNDQKLGTIGDVGCFSFYKTKNFSTFEGGAIAVKKDSKVDFLKICGIADPIENKGNYIGYNFRMSDLCALVGYEKLKLHRNSVTSEIGRYSEKDGYYPKLVYQLPAFMYQFKGCCPIAEKIVKKIAKRIK
jgi:dTDP-4-amino-4,6-dideoxygalactose transaminase